jgi:hypothetical protein
MGPVRLYQRREIINYRNKRNGSTAELAEQTARAPAHPARQSQWPPHRALRCRTTTTSWSNVRTPDGRRLPRLRETGASSGRSAGGQRRAARPSKPVNAQPPALGARLLELSAGSRAVGAGQVVTSLASGPTARGLPVSAWHTRARLLESRAGHGRHAHCAGWAPAAANAPTAVALPQHPAGSPLPAQALRTCATSARRSTAKS